MKMIKTTFPPVKECLIGITRLCYFLQEGHKIKCWLPFVVVQNKCLFGINDIRRKEEIQKNKRELFIKNELPKKFEKKRNVFSVSKRNYSSSLNIEKSEDLYKNNNNNNYTHNNNTHNNNTHNNNTHNNNNNNTHNNNNNYTHNNNTHNNNNRKIRLTDNFSNEQNLKKEIFEVHKKLTDNSFIQKKKEEIYVLLKTAISPNLKGRIYFVGSCENNIWINNSDIDCCIVVENCDDKNSSLYILQIIKNAINLIHPSLTIRIIKATVPIAKIYKGNTNICDISINNTVAIVNTHLVTTLCHFDQRVTIINRIIKYWAKQKNINDRSQGTFSSYALFLLTYFFFQNLEVPLLPTYKTIEREDAPFFEINSEYFFLQDEVQMPFYTNVNDIKLRFPQYKMNKDHVSKLLYGFFEYYSNDVCKDGITLDIYNNRLIENKEMTANICCPITKKVVNTYSINTWKKIFNKIHTAYEEMKNGKSLYMICEEMEDATPNKKIDLKDHLIRRQYLKNIFIN